MQICIIGDDNDLSAAYIGWLAEKRGANVITLSEGDYGIGWTFRMAEKVGQGSIDTDRNIIDLSGIDGALVRLNPEPPIPAILGIPKEIEHIYALERRYGLQWLLDNAPFPVVNRPHAGRSNSSKPYQMMRLSAAGFRVPSWVVTNDPQTAVGFMDSHGGQAIYKACSGLRSHVRLADDALIARLKGGSSPVVLQEYISGVDVRVHVVGRKTFATEVRSEAIDYRFEAETNHYGIANLPSSIQELCKTVAAAEELAIAGFDFRRAPDETWWCLEVNPVPTFLPYEAATGHPIGDAVIDLFGASPRPGNKISRLHSLL